MKPSEIIVQDANRHGVNGDQLLRGIAAQIQSGKTFMMNANDSVLTLTKIGDESNSFALHLFTLDSPLTLAKSLNIFIKTIRNIPGAQSVYGDTDNQQILNLLKRLGVDVLNSDLDGFTWMARI